MMAIGSQINGGKIHGDKPDLSAPGLSVNTESLLGPEGLKVVCDYRSVLAEVLAGVMGNQNLENVFPSFKSQRVGLASNLIR